MMERENHERTEALTDPHPAAEPMQGAGTTADERSGARAGVWAALGLTVIFAAATVYSLKIYAPCDDTYIYLVYVKNLLGGHGLTFNGMKVWGFTSVLWTMIIAGFGAVLSFVDLPFVAEKLGLIAGFLAMMATYQVGRKMGMSRPHALIAPALLAATWDFVFYMSNGLETMLFSAMLVWSIGFVLTEDPDRSLRSFRLPAVLSITILARPEGFLVAAIVIAYLAYRSGEPMPVIRCFAWMLAWIVPVVVALRVYYGAWLPNTFYAKAGAGLSNVDQGFAYFMDFFHAAWPLLALLVLIVVVRFRAMGRRVLPFVGLIAVCLADTSIRGGDNMVGFRALLPVVPVIYLVIAWGLRGLNRKITLVTIVAIAAYNVLLYNFGTVTGSSWHLPVQHQADAWRRVYDIRKDMGLYLKTHFPPNAVVALNAAGVIPFYSEQTTIDMLGLNNVYIARYGKRDRRLVYGHQAGDGNYVLKCKPDVIIFGGLGQDQATYFLSDREISDSDAFRRNYRARTFPHNQRVYVRRGPGDRSR